MSRSRLRVVAALVLLSACGADRIVGNSPAALRPGQPRFGMDAINGCPAFFELRGALAGTPQDRNGDGYVCELVLANGVTVVIDNNIPPNQIGECPPNFNRVPYMMGEGGYDPTDRNQNGYLCTVTKSNGQVVTVDDNLR